MTAVRRNSAFTLAELVVAVTITVMIGGATAAMLQSSSAVRQRVSRQSELQTRARQAADGIASALRSAWQAGNGEWALEGLDESIGDMPADSIRFFTVTRPNVRLGCPESDIKECEFAVSLPEDGSPPVLLRRLDPTANEEPDGGGVVEMMAEKVLGLNIRYFQDGLWVDEWPLEAEGWPVAIQIELAVAGNTEKEIWTANRLVSYCAEPGQFVTAEDEEEEEAP